MGLFDLFKKKKSSKTETNTKTNLDIYTKSIPLNIRKLLLISETRTTIRILISNIMLETPNIFLYFSISLIFFMSSMSPLTRTSNVVSNRVLKATRLFIYG
ncbi:hypothetical protein IGI37_000234 [Enterococcus sp. AZ194]